MGDIYFEVNIRSNLTLKDVRHVPNLQLNYNLTSGFALDEQGYESYLGKVK